MPIAHAIISSLYCIIKNKFSEGKCTHMLIRKTFRSLTFGAYIRFIYQIYIFLVLASVSEIYMFSNISGGRRLSLSIACFIVTFCVVFMLVSIWQFIKSLKDNNLEKMYYFVEFFSGIKGTRKARIYALMFLLRRTILCCIVLLFHEIMSLTTLNSVFVFFQFCYLIFSVFFKPFSELKDNALEVINEIFYTILCSTLIYYKSEDRWNKVFEYTYIGIMMVNNFIFALISFVFMIKAIIKFVKKCLENKRNKNKYKINVKPTAIRMDEGTSKVGINDDHSRFEDNNEKYQINTPVASKVAIDECSVVSFDEYEKKHPKVYSRNDVLKDVKKNQKKNRKLSIKKSIKKEVHSHRSDIEATSVNNTKVKPMRTQRKRKKPVYYQRNFEDYDEIY